MICYLQYNKSVPGLFVCHCIEVGLLTGDVVQVLCSVHCHSTLLPTAHWHHLLLRKSIQYTLHN